MGPPIDSSPDPDVRCGPLLPLVGLRRAEVPKHDGAQHLGRLDVGQAVVRLVAHHSWTRIEAAVRGLEAELSDFSHPPAEYEDALYYCGMTSGPSGDPIEAAGRLDEIQVRYSPGHPVSRSRAHSPDDLEFPSPQDGYLTLSPGYGHLFADELDDVAARLGDAMRYRSDAVRRRRPGGLNAL